MNALISLRPRGCPPGIDPRRWHELLVARIEWQLTRIDRLLAALDAMDGDFDLEPSLGVLERSSRACGFCVAQGDGSQEHWSDGLPGDYEREDEHEHGGDILVEPHDGDPDFEYSLGWSIPNPDTSQG